MGGRGVLNGFLNFPDLTDIEGFPDWGGWGGGDHSKSGNESKERTKKIGDIRKNQLQ